MDTRFYNLVLGKHRKYSSALYPDPANMPVEEALAGLDDAESAMLEVYAKRAQIKRGGEKLRVLDLGCGWGSVTLWFAANFPQIDVVGFSNSRTQRALKRCSRAALFDCHLGVRMHTDTQTRRHAGTHHPHTDIQVHRPPFFLPIYSGSVYLPYRNNRLSFSLALAPLPPPYLSYYPSLPVPSPSSSMPGKYILAEAKRRGLTNVDVITGNIVEFEYSEEAMGGQFDRVISIEMFEHMKNYQKLFKKVSSFLKPKGLLFVHIFVTHNFPYHFVTDGSPADWMARFFFRGGT